ncbi:energy transducer TonB [Dyella psychrodurans]|uniref:Energy transducer TonB n=2 Tax=Dyella psychrodurans TaxID=1927960 RepID=A0A370WY65_9GAMM|nr:energy transducer TonB [Dyella psychrodurans]
MDFHDLHEEQLTVTPVLQNNGESAYHVTGQFALEWLSPKNPDEAAQIFANQNRCKFIGVDCQPGPHHTIYVDVTATQGQTSTTLNISGNESLDQTIEEQRNETIGNLSGDNPNLSKAVVDANPPHCKPVIVRRSTPAPAMPPQSLRQRHVGTTKLQILLNSDGTIRDAKVYESSGYRELDRAALEAASRWSFGPVVCAGTNEPAIAAFQVPVNFDLQKKPQPLVPQQ